MSGVKSGGQGKHSDVVEAFAFVGGNWSDGWMGEMGEEKTASISFGGRGTVRVEVSTRGGKE